MLLAPVDVLDQHDGGSLRDDLLEELDPRVLEAVARGEGVEPVGHIEPKRQAQYLARAEALEHHRRRVALEDAEMLLQHLRKGPVGDALAVRKAPPGAPQRLRRAAAQAFPEFAHDPCLADPRIPEDRHELRFPPVLDLFVGSLEHLHLLVPADEGPAEAPDATWTHKREPAHEASAFDPFRLPFGLDRLRLRELERTARGCDRPLADKDLAWLGRLLQSRRHVDGVAGDEGAALARLADDDLAGVDADPQRERLAEQLAQAPLHRQRPVQRPLGVILERNGGAEHRHHGVAGELLDGPAGGIDFLGHGIVEAVEQRPRSLRILRPAELGRADEVGEHDRRELPFAPVRVRIHRSPARQAEACSLGKSGATGSAHIHHTRL